MNKKDLELVREYTLRKIYSQNLDPILEGVALSEHKYIFRVLEIALMQLEAGKKLEELFSE